MPKKPNRSPEGLARWRRAIGLWQKEHRPHRAMMARRHRRKIIDDVITRLGGCCALCGETRRPFLTLDHVNNDGAAERRRRGSNDLIYRRLKSWGTILGIIDRYRVLCYNCNCSPRVSSHRARALQKIRDRDHVITMYGGRCVCCGEQREQYLTIDHVNGDGAVDRRAHGSNAHVYRQLLGEGTLLGLNARYRVLCWNCNCARGHLGYCPHDHERGEEGA